jgi:glutathione S-transferase
VPRSNRLTHYGWPISHFSAKTRSYLTFKGVEFDDCYPTGLRLLFVIQRAVGRVVMPTVRMPNGQWLQDSSAIIDELEARHPTPAIHPKGASQQLASYLLEYFADEWMQLTSLHSRWDTPGNARRAKYDFAHYAFPWLPVWIAQRFTQPMTEQMLGYQPATGVTDATRPGIDAMLLTLLDAMEQQLGATDYLLGARPSLGDFALYGPLSSHTAHEPDSKHLIAERPAVGGWLERLSRSVAATREFLPDDHVPEALDPVFRMIFEEQMPWLRTVVTAIDRYVEEHPDALRVPRALGVAPFEVCGHRGERKIVTFTQWKGQRVRGAYEAAAGRADPWLARFGEPAALIPEIRHPLTRKDFKEILM